MPVVDVEREVEMPKWTEYTSLIQFNQLRGNGTPMRKDAPVVKITGINRTLRYIFNIFVTLIFVSATSSILTSGYSIFLLYRAGLVYCK